MLAGLVKCYIDSGEKILVIKNGSGIMQLSTSFIIYNDVRRFTAGGNLDSFCKTWGVTLCKGAFPYEAYTSVQEMKQAVNWPTIESFKSSLKINRSPLSNLTEKLIESFVLVQSNKPELISTFKDMLCLGKFFSNVPDDIRASTDLRNLKLNTDEIAYPFCPILYTTNWIKFEELRYLSSNSYTMHCYYKHYAGIDTEILILAFERYCRKFIEVYDVNPLEFISLPSLAGVVVWKEFSRELADPFSFSKEYGHINQLIRSNIRGGLSAVFHRHAEVGLEHKYGKNVHCLENGNPIKRIVSYDFNSLYAYCMEQDLPCGPGICYEKEKNGFRWKSMLKKTSNWSMQSLEWLNYLQNIEPYCSAGRIQHAMNSGEEKFSLKDPETNEMHSFYPDGYIEINGVKTFIFFDGCLYHECPFECETTLKSNKTKNDAVRDRVCKHHGNFVNIFGCQWDEMKKNLEYRNFTSVFFNRKTLISEKEIWAKIETGDLFGMVEVDIYSPPETVKFFTQMNFAPIFAHINVTEEMMSPQTARFIHETKSRKFPLDKQLSLKFHAKKHLITTEMALFYKAHGMILSNMTLCLEYQRGKPLKKFIETITKQRIAATYSGDESLATIVKLTGNASYGKTIMNLKKRVKYSYLKNNDTEEIEKIKDPYHLFPLHFLTPIN